MHHDQETLFIGIDGGGTKCRARIISADNTVLGAGLGGPSNPFHGQAQAIASISTAVELALADAGMPPSAVNQLIAGVGLAGVSLPSVYEAMKLWSYPFKKMHLTTDLKIACLGAHGGADGAVIIAGTGSCGYALVNGAETILGGHGFQCGDQGSGAWIGLEAIKAVLLASDGLGQSTLLTELIREYLGVSGGMIVDKLGAAKSSDFAQLSPLVFDAAKHDDEVALQIVQEAAHYIQVLAEKLWQAGAPRLSLMGGLSSLLMPWLNPDIGEAFLPPLQQPEFGAVYYARQQEMRVDV